MDCGSALSPELGREMSQHDERLACREEEGACFCP